jgi:4-hydroxybenzoate polyprenyltransferase
MNWYFILTLSGLLLGLIVCTVRTNLLLFVILLFIAVSLWYYSRWMQKHVLIGNFVVAILCCLLPTLSLLYIYGEIEIEYAQRGTDFMTSIGKGLTELAVELIALPYIFLAFSLTFVRELTKDIQDIEGDEINEYRTFPIAYGFRKAKNLTLFLLLIIVAAEIVIAISLISDLNSISVLAIILIFILAPISISTYHASKMNTPSEAGLVSKWLKISMALGIATTAFFWFL